MPARKTAAQAAKEKVITPTPKARKTPQVLNKPTVSLTNIADPALVVQNTTGDAIQAEKEAVASDSNTTVTAIVPKAFKLNLENGGLIDYEAGVQEMPLHHASHWYSRANGVKVYDPKAK